jgi:cold shock CspA family protein
MLIAFFEKNTFSLTLTLFSKTKKNLISCLKITNMPKGKVKFFNVKNKFGFITDLISGKEYYTHSKNLAQAVKEGDTVTFEISESSRGPVAIHVQKAQD